METGTYQQMSPLQIALGVYMNLSKKAKKEFKKTIANMEEAEFDITKTEAYKESMRDVEEGRVHEVGSIEELKLLLLNTGTHSDLF